MLQEESFADESGEVCGGGGGVDSAEDEDEDDDAAGDLTQHSGNTNFVNEMLEQMEVSPDGEKKCPICSRVLKVPPPLLHRLRDVTLLTVISMTQCITRPVRTKGNLWFTQQTPLS